MYNWRRGMMMVDRSRNIGESWPSNVLVMEVLAESVVTLGSGTCAAGRIGSLEILESS